MGPLVFHLGYVYSFLMVNHDYVDAGDSDIDDDDYLNLDLSLKNSST